MAKVRWEEKKVSQFFRKAKLLGTLGGIQTSDL